MRGVCVECLIGKQKKPILLNGLERLQALALFWVPQDDPLVTPAARENLTVGRKGDRPDLTVAIFSNVREHTSMSGESPLALAVCDAPQPYCSVIRPTDELPRISWVELDAGDATAAIFSDVRFLVNFSTPLPR